MLTRDALRLILHPARRQPLRTTLTLLGVVVGSTALVFSLSLGLGLRELIDREFKARSLFWELGLRPRLVSEAASPHLPPEVLDPLQPLEPLRAQRLKRRLEAEWRSLNRTPPLRPITPAALAPWQSHPELRDLTVVQAVFGTMDLAGRKV